MPKPLLLTALTAILVAATPLQAHHEASGFDRNNTVMITGVVKEFRWTTPHAWIYVGVPRGAADGRSGANLDEWAFEGASIAEMVRRGWKNNSLRAGDRVKVLAAPRKDGKRGGEFLSVTLLDTGKVLQLGNM